MKTSPRLFRFALQGVFAGVALNVVAVSWILDLEPLDATSEWVERAVIWVRWETMSPEELASLRDAALGTAAEDDWFRWKDRRHIPLLVDPEYPGVPNVEGLNFRIVTESEVMYRAEHEGRFGYCGISKPRFAWSHGTIGIFCGTEFPARSHRRDLGARGVRVQCYHGWSGWSCHTSRRWLS